MSIKKLPHDISSRIAAGEVIDRPASAIKELLENSLDAGAKRMRVFLEQGGKISFCVEDDGCGIHYEELPLAVERYATSKIEVIEDLDRIRTLGYRGEALASVAAVSRMELRTRAAGALEGGVIRIEGGSVLLHASVPSACGTRIQVDDLFFNLPVRRKFLKSAPAELRHVTAVVRDYALVHPDRHFQVFSDGKRILDLGQESSTEGVLSKLWGEDTVVLKGTMKRDHVEARIWWSALPGSRRTNTTVFVNSRRVQDSTVRAAINATEGSVAGDWLILIDLPPEEVDVNIHPTKQEVRFRNSGRIFELIHRVAKQLLMERTGLGSASVVSDPWECVESNPPNVTGQPALSRVAASYTAPQPPGSSSLWEVIPADATDQIQERTEIREKRKFIGQTPKGYLLFTDRDGFQVVDPHAAHERILFEEICRSFAEGIPMQQLAFPQEIPEAVAPEAVLYREDLLKMGFRLESGKEEPIKFRLEAVPVVRGLAHLSPVELLRATLRGIDEEPDPLKRDREVWWRWARTACRDAVKLGRLFLPHEAQQLLENLELCEQPYSCPHGRPTVITVSDERLYAWFERS